MEEALWAAVNTGLPSGAGRRENKNVHKEKHVSAKDQSEMY